MKKGRERTVGGEKTEEYFPENESLQELYELFSLSVDGHRDIEMAKERHTAAMETKSQNKRSGASF